MIKPIEWIEEEHSSKLNYESPLFKANIAYRGKWVLEYEYGNVFHWTTFDDLGSAEAAANEALRNLISKYLA